MGRGASGGLQGQEIAGAISRMPGDTWDRLGSLYLAFGADSHVPFKLSSDQLPS